MLRQHGKINWITSSAMVVFHIGAVAALFMFSWPAFFTALFLYWIAGSFGIGLTRGSAASPKSTRNTPYGPPCRKFKNVLLTRQPSLAQRVLLRVTSFSTDKLDKEVFQIPAGYRESHLDLREMWILGVGK
jgi:hypothetical protein